MYTGCAEQYPGLGSGQIRRFLAGDYASASEDHLDDASLQGSGHYGRTVMVKTVMAKVYPDINQGRRGAHGTSSKVTNKVRNATM